MKAFLLDNVFLSTSCQCFAGLVFVGFKDYSLETDQNEKSLKTAASLD